MSFNCFFIGIYQHLFIFQEYEHKILPWLYIFAVFTILRFLGWLFFSIVNDLIFGYNITMCLLWAIFCGLNIYGWILVYSLYLELSDLTKLEDLAHLRVSLFWLSQNYNVKYPRLKKMCNLPSKFYFHVLVNQILINSISRLTKLFTKYGLLKSYDLVFIFGQVADKGSPTLTVYF